jgi:hypothetical protein
MNARIRFPMQDGCDPLRQCALVLHSIRAEDRKWLLAHLTGALVPELKQLVGELQVLGMPADPSAAQIAIKARTSAQHIGGPPDSSAPHGRPQRRADLQRSRANALAEALRDEPVGLIARVIWQRDATEQKWVLAKLDAAKRRRVKERMSASDTNDLSIALGPRSLQALDEQLAIRLAHSADIPAPARKSSGVVRHALRFLRLTKVRP